MVWAPSGGPVPTQSAVVGPTLGQRDPLEAAAVSVRHDAAGMSQIANRAASSRSLCMPV